MRARWRDIDAVLAAIVPAREPLLVSDLGVVRGEDAGLGRTGVLARAAREPDELVVVGITPRTIALVPVANVRGALRALVASTLEPHLEAAELLPREQVIVERGAVERRASKRVVPVRFVRRDGSAVLVEMLGDPLAWVWLPT